jgi:hypothetical protein
VSDGPKIRRVVLVGQLFVGFIYAGLMALRASGFPPSVKANNSPLTVAIGCLFYFLLTVGLFNFSHIAGAKGYRILSLFLLVCAVLMIPWLLMISLAQY